jgi:regulatory protein
LPVATVTLLRARRRRTDRVDVHLDGVYALTLPLERAAELSVGQELDRSAVRCLEEEARAADARDRALRLLAVRPRCRRELLSALARRGAGQDTAARVVARLEELGLVDDAAFARWWVEDRCAHRPRARRGLAFELGRVGVSPEVIRDALAAVDDEALALEAARQGARRCRSMDRDAFERRLGGWMARRGFAHQAVRAAVARVWAENGSADPPTE